MHACIIMSVNSKVVSQCYVHPYIAVYSLINSAHLHAFFSDANFYRISEEAWKFLFGIYGGGPELPFGHVANPQNSLAQHQTPSSTSSIICKSSSSLTTTSATKHLSGSPQNASASFAKAKSNSASAFNAHW